MGQKPTRGIYGVLITATLFFSLLQSIVTPLMPFLRDRFGIGQEQVTWLITGYLVVAAVATPLIGQLGDRFGRGVMLRITMVAFCSGAVVAAMTDSFGWLVAARMLQGLGGGIFPLAYGIIRERFAPLKVAGAIGGLSSVMAVGSGIGVLVVGPVTELFGYHSLFWIISSVGALVTLAVFVVIPVGDSGRKQPTDWIGIVLLTAWIVQLLYASTIGNEAGWLSVPVLSLTAGFLVSFLLWLMWENRCHYPLINLRTMRHRTVMIGNVVAFLFGIVMFASNTFLVAFLQAPASTGYGLGASVTVTGLVLLPETLVFLVTGSIAGYVAHRFGSRSGVLGGAILSTLGFGGLAFWNNSFTAIIVLSVVGGLGVGLFFAQITNLIMPAIPASETGAVTGMNNMIRNIGGALGGQVCAVLVGMPLAQSGAFQGGFQLVFGFLGFASVLALAACLLLPREGVGARVRA